MNKKTRKEVKKMVKNDPKLKGVRIPVIWSSEMDEEMEDACIDLKLYAKKTKNGKSKRTR